MTLLQAFDPLEILGALHRRDVRFVVIGGVAGYLFGSNLPSANLDICFAADVANGQHLIAALADMRARLCGGESIQIDDRTLELDGVLRFRTDYGLLHCVRTPLGTGGYDDLQANAERMEVDGVATDVASIPDLIRMKEVSHRIKDQVAVDALRITQKLGGKR
jgi:hypothetical protein